MQKVLVSIPIENLDNPTYAEVANGLTRAIHKISMTGEIPNGEFDVFMIADGVSPAHIFHKTIITITPQ